MVGDTFPTLVFVLCFATSAACAWLLWRSYRRTGVRLLMWSGLCFAFLALNNAFVVVDLVLIKEISFQIPRLLAVAAAVVVMLFGLVWDNER